jgi:hypothetical protein
MLSPTSNRRRESSLVVLSLVSGVILSLSACSSSHTSQAGASEITSNLMTHPWTSATQVSTDGWMFTWHDPMCQEPVTFPIVSYANTTMTVTFYSQPPRQPNCHGGIALEQSLVKFAHPLAGRTFVDGACSDGQPYRYSTDCQSPKVIKPMQ